MLPGTARKPASLKRSSSQPSNLVGTLSHQAESPAAPIMGPLSRRRNDSSTAFLSHWLTVQAPLPPRSATRALPRSSRSSAVSTASRTGPLVEGLMSFRFSKASSMVLARSACMAVPGFAVFVGVQGGDVKRVEFDRLQFGATFGPNTYAKRHKSNVQSQYRHGSCLNAIPDQHSALGQASMNSGERHAFRENQGWHRDFLQGLGQRPAHRVQPWLATIGG